MPRDVDSSRRRIVARWRSLTGGRDVRDTGRPTVVALSGGADSSGLLIALSSVRNTRLVAAHIRHGLRPEALQNRDRDAAAALAERLGVPFVSRDIDVPAQGNAESGARRLRYSALARIAEDSDCKFVATAHHAEDQLETMLMALTRGAGPRGLAGIRPMRQLSDMVLLVRPTLTVTRADLRAICDEARWQPVHDETNDDLSRRRAWLRAEVVPKLLANADTSLPLRLGSSGQLLREAQTLAEDRAAAVLAQADQSGHALTLRIESLAEEPALVVGEVIRRGIAVLAGDAGRDRLGWNTLAPIIRAVHARGMHAKTFETGTVRIVVTARSLTIEPHEPPV